jgi:hypothetical protein
MEVGSKELHIQAIKKLMEIIYSLDKTHCTL